MTQKTKNEIRAKIDRFEKKEKSSKKSAQPALMGKRK